VRPTTCLWIINGLAQDKIMVSVWRGGELLQKAKEHLEGYTDMISASYNKFCDIT